LGKLPKNLLTTSKSPSMGRVSSPSSLDEELEVGEEELKESY
jgi:hypothetical protein